MSGRFGERGGVWEGGGGRERVSYVHFIQPAICSLVEGVFVGFAPSMDP